MNPVRALPLAFLFSAIAFPQNLAKQFTLEMSRASCPVELTASLRSTGEIMPILPVQNGRKSGDKQQLEITLSNPKSEIISAGIIIYGFPIGGRIDPAVLYSPHSPDEIAKTISFDQSVGVGKTASYAVALTTFSAISSIELDSIAYSDGSSWHRADRKLCRALPLPLDAAKAISR